MSEEQYFHNIPMDNNGLNWKRDKTTFQKFKIRYAALLGMLHGLKLASQQQPELAELYQKVYQKVQEECEGICADTFNCGQWDLEPTLDWVIEDDYLQTLFPLSEQSDEN